MKRSKQVAPPQQEPDALSSWWRVFLTGLVLWIASVVVTGATSNTNLIPTVVLLGSFLVPVTAVIWYLNHYHSPILSPRLVLYAFIVGGILGLLAACLLEAWMRSDGLLGNVGVGLIEEFVKLVTLIIIARGLSRYTTRDGIVLGAAVGFGFAAFESSGYALNALVTTTQGGEYQLSLYTLLYNELIRGVLAPVGHGLWTAILGGVLFSASRGSHLRITGKVVGAYLLVALLHAVNNSMRGIAIVLTALLTTTQPPQIPLTLGTLPPPTEEQRSVFLVIEGGWILLISVVGLLVLWRLWRRSGVGSSTMSYGFDA